mgnify:CR=1 FL=1
MADSQELKALGKVVGRQEEPVRRLENDPFIARWGRAAVTAAANKVLDDILVQSSAVSPPWKRTPAYSQDSTG